MIDTTLPALLFSSSGSSLPHIGLGARSPGQCGVAVHGSTVVAPPRPGRVELADVPRLAGRVHLANLPDLVVTPLGRRQIQVDLFLRLWRPLFLLGRLYRQTLLRRARLVAVTGSVGKTTTSHAIVTALGDRPAPWLEQNESSFLASGLLRLPPWARHGVVEVAVDRPGMMAGRADLVRPDIVVVTAIAHEHTRSLGSLEGVRDEKAVLVRALRPDGLAVLNGDDPHVRWMAGQTHAAVLTYGFGTDCDVRASDYALDWPRGSLFTIQAAGQTQPVRSRLLGRHQVYPLLAAVAVALRLGRPLGAALSALETLPPTPTRLEPIPLAGGAWLLRDEFKSPLETIEAALDLLAEIPASRKTVVIGEVSEPPGSKGPIYQQIGARLARVATRVIVVGSNHQPYAAGAVRAGLPRSAIVNAGHDLERAVELIRQDLGPDEVVLVKGRNTQRLERISLALLGQGVGCDLEFCNVVAVTCDRCPMLEPGWQGRRAIMARR